MKTREEAKAETREKIKAKIDKEMTKEKMDDYLSLCKYKVDKNKGHYETCSNDSHGFICPNKDVKQKVMYIDKNCSGEKNWGPFCRECAEEQIKQDLLIWKLTKICFDNIFRSRKKKRKVNND